MIDISVREQKKEKTELILKNIYKLPSIPEIMNETLKLLNNKSTTTTELSKVISKDQSFVTKVLTIANSPLYGLQRKITSIDFAILILGYSELRNIVSVLSLAESFLNKSDHYLNNKDLWLHSYLSGLLAKRLADDFNMDNSGEAFIAGFLHDLGVSVIHKYFHSNFIAIHEMAFNNNISFPDAEVENLGIDHQQVGSFLMERWNFPPSIISAVLYHHYPQNAVKNIKLTSIVHLADFITQNFGLEEFIWDKDLQLNPAAINALGLKDEYEVKDMIDTYKPIIISQAEDIRYLH